MRMRRWTAACCGLLMLTACGAPGLQTAPDTPAGDGAEVASGDRSLLSTRGPDFTRRPPVTSAESEVTHVRRAGRHRVHSGYRHHHIFGRLGDIYAGSLFPYLGSPLGRPGLFFTDLATSSLYSVPALVGVRHMRLGRGGRFLVFMRDGVIGLYDLRTQLVRTFPALRGLALGSALSFDVDAFGNISYVDALGRVHVFDTDTNQDYIVPMAGRLGTPNSPIAMSGNGQLLAVPTLRDGRSELLLTDLRSNRQATLPFEAGLSDRLSAFSLSTDGRCLLFQDGPAVRLLDTRSGLVDRLAALNLGRPGIDSGIRFGGVIRDAAFLDGSCNRIVFNRNGRLQVFDRTRGVIDTMPVANRLGTMEAVSRLGGLSWAPVWR